MFTSVLSTFGKAWKMVLPFNPVKEVVEKKYGYVDWDESVSEIPPVKVGNPDEVKTTTDKTDAVQKKVP